VLVDPDLSVPGHPEVFVVGDLAAARWPERGADAAKTDPTISDKGRQTRFVPGVAPAAIQMGKFAGRQIKRSLKGEPREQFRYLDKGSLATIGRSRAVADFGRLHVSGYFAWLSWLFIHLFFLIGFRNRIMVMAEWAWAYVTYNHSARLITEPKETVSKERPKAKAG
jgi:NADH dehydrogenase